MFVVGNGGDEINEYSLSTAFNISTASYVQNFSVQSQALSTQGITFNNDGTKMYVVDQTDADVNEYSLSTAFDVSTASYVQLFSVALQERIQELYHLTTLERRCLLLEHMEMM